MEFMSKLLKTLQAPDDQAGVRFLLGTSLGTVVFLYHIQFSKGMGGVWLRPSETGGTVFVPGNALRLMLSPFRLLGMWHHKMWDLNWPLVAITGGVLAWAAPAFAIHAG
eukprot:NODE_7357_length_445_cov_9.097484_g7191_i0.p1 GENE.NODE_7357_length_445_cov_9.097484_g7191_i0~~NODE_7357_length_445_cov_9.097484_g7191_i0.p1  ORF type:complete len:124 (+),score=46.77 NODE_7357_length_445_cov_9.097484_g7191_i0:48-374(+)